MCLLDHTGHSVWVIVQVKENSGTRAGTWRVACSADVPGLEQSRQLSHQLWVFEICNSDPFCARQEFYSKRSCWLANGASTEGRIP